MSEEMIPEKPKRTLGRAMPKFLQGGGSVMIFGAKRPTSTNEYAPSSNPDVPAVDPQTDQASGPSTDSDGPE